MRSGIDAMSREGRNVIEGKLYVEGRDLRVYSLGGLAQRRDPVDEPKCVKSYSTNRYQPNINTMQIGPLMFGDALNSNKFRHEGSVCRSRNT
jgi:hypothetical protein